MAANESAAKASVSELLRRELERGGGVSGTTIVDAVRRERDADRGPRPGSDLRDRLTH
jgi:hypothetical protein